ncbi:Uncharacterized metal-binding protein YceD, DUF177 family [Sphingomonas guangdongensis]|uniref:Uncharacterized metal-binding protein YceD, DUF177 family n=1 Tax=Sphingomonas guangdongensis TaxID=1141890 RepID=A0A285QAI1_9SPHN|nr:YceD family protein [Sphingomonas guangdongensis]SOB78930.1 Uncharacterized metal-binding protein YceD, DUF177 family [Sphingomonas guangdongensis]
MSGAPEFSRPRRLDTIGQGEAATRIEADDAERAALARRFDLLGVERLAAEYALRRDAAGIVATGHLLAAVTQRCIGTGDPVPAIIEEDFALRFVPEGVAVSGDEEVELDAGDLDVVFFAGGAIDLGEAAAETLALALDPYPRSPAAAAALRDAGVLSEEEAKPAGALAGLKDLLQGGATRD